MEVLKDHKVRSFVEKDMKKFPEFKKLSNNVDRFKFCYHLLEKYGIPPVNVSPEPEKDENLALKARKHGNELFLQRQYKYALEMYNKSLCHAPDGSESLAIAYSNRSMVYLRTGFYKFCLENIELALENKNIPQHLIPKLMDRKKKCLELMETKEDSEEKYKPAPKGLSYPANPKIPFIVDALKVIRDDKFGRGVVATRDLKPGDIISIENPFIKNLMGRFVYSSCFNCTQTNFLNLKPCNKSTMVMFCSKKCSDETWNGYYKYIYPILPKLYAEPAVMDKLLFSLSCSLRAIVLFKNQDELKELLEPVDKNSKTIFDYDLTVPDDEIEATKLKIFFNLCTNEDKRPLDEAFMHTKACAFSWHYVKDLDEVKKLLHTEELKNIFLGLLMKAYWISLKSHDISNAMTRKPNSPRETIWFADSIGNGISLFHNLLNHSCAANVGRFPNFNSEGIVVLRPIKAGEQIFDAYEDNHHNALNKQQRKAQLKERHYFDCKCEACAKNYPSSDVVQFKGVISLQMIKEISEIIENVKFDDKGLKNVAKTEKNISKTLLKIAKSYPCLDYSSLAEGFYMCSLITVYKKPMEYIFMDV